MRSEPRRSPKLTGAVERAHRTHLEECCEVVPVVLDLPTLNRQLRVWEHVYNTQRPHQAPARRAPADATRERPLAP